MCLKIFESFSYVGASDVLEAAKSLMLADQEPTKSAVNERSRSKFTFAAMKAAQNYEEWLKHHLEKVNNLPIRSLKAFDAVDQLEGEGAIYPKVGDSKGIINKGNLDRNNQKDYKCRDISHSPGGTLVHTTSQDNTLVFLMPVHCRDLINYAKDGVYAKDLISDYIQGVLILAKETKNVLVWEAGLFRWPFVRGVRVRKGVPHLGHPFTDPDGKIMQYEDRVLHGGRDSDIVAVDSCSPFTFESVCKHPEYEAWLKKHLFASRKKNAI
ncbi:uncharacterized protein Bfra_010446 [Botrytis fragariae]|uniref:Uncharacterized protein n=1 Tax=Botrytis fragariae TaxID=1964551 RepID=A0A8H6AFS3_9HELO|nr:uncharacterized protein Bfra_010446 [Botrytis fragariae]KAF5867472.1 hypothetical protein Bfra_010446 [Botrytis fragariae]